MRAIAAAVAFAAIVIALSNIATELMNPQPANDSINVGRYQIEVMSGTDNPPSQYPSFVKIDTQTGEWWWCEMINEALGFCQGPQK